MDGNNVWTGHKAEHVRDYRGNVAGVARRWRCCGCICMEIGRALSLHDEELLVAMIFRLCDAFGMLPLLLLLSFDELLLPIVRALSFPIVEKSTSE